MNLNNISLPYPVLGINDDITPLLPENSVTVDLSSNVKTYIFVIHLNFSNKDIENLIKEGKAKFSCEYECAKTMLRRCIKTANNNIEIAIPRHSINGRINFNCFVSVQEPIPNYTNSGFNEDYKGYTFKMEEGDILVAFPQFHYDADINYDKLQAAGSFMQIRESSLHEEVFFDITGNKIEILLPTQLYQCYCNPQVKGSAEVIHSSLVLNALTYALLNIEDHEQTTWAKTIRYRLENEDGYSPDDLTEASNIPCLAQRLLRNPYARLFSSIMNHQKSSED